jgi:shikimate kinase
MIIGLIGMSGAGKSSWAERLATAGYAWLHCDALIAERLRGAFDIGDGSVYDLGAWMGFPYEARYAEREALYLAHETAVMQAIADTLAATPAQNTIVDMTGSAIYVDSHVLRRLRQLATIVYLAVSDTTQARMLQHYLDSPRPVIWHGAFQPLPGEAPTAALARCYPVLLAERDRRYRALSRVTLDDTHHRDPAYSVDTFLRAIAGSPATPQTHE